MTFSLRSFVRGRPADDDPLPEAAPAPVYLPALREALRASPAKPIVKITWKGRSPRRYYVQIDGAQLVDSMNRNRWFRTKAKAQEAADFMIAVQSGSLTYSEPAPASTRIDARRSGRGARLWVALVDGQRLKDRRGIDRRFKSRANALTAAEADAALCEASYSC